jgi:hypothetical protein
MSQKLRARGARKGKAPAEDEVLAALQQAVVRRWFTLPELAIKWPTPLDVAIKLKVGSTGGEAGTFTVRADQDYACPAESELEGGCAVLKSSGAA